uniref:Ig-like domain-containing protein n=1 Tax=Astatotilapia calliptera TaxID=8154 RepID=A0AAX7UCL5_ASTCA
MSFFLPQHVFILFPPLPEPGSARGFFLLKGSFSFPLLPMCLKKLCSVLLLSNQLMLFFDVPSVHQKEVHSGEDSVELPFSIEPDLPDGAKVEWTDKDNRKVQVYHNTSDLNELQHRFYRHRTEMNEGLIKAGDLTLTLKYPTDWDSGIYTCTRNILMKKQMELKVRGHFHLSIFFSLLLWLPLVLHCGSPQWTGAVGAQSLVR